MSITLAASLNIIYFTLANALLFITRIEERFKSKSINILGIMKMHTKLHFATNSFNSRRFIINSCLIHYNSRV